MEWPSQSLDLNPIEMLWHDLKQSFHARKLSNVAELKQFCKEEWAEIPPQRCERLIASYRKRKRVAQPVIRFRGHLLFHVGPSRFGQLFSLNKWNHYFKTAFCIYSGYLCVVLKFVWWSESFKCDICKKNKKTGRGQKPFHGTIYIYTHTHTHTQCFLWDLWRQVTSHINLHIYDVTASSLHSDKFWHFRSVLLYELSHPSDKINIHLTCTKKRLYVVVLATLLFCLIQRIACVWVTNYAHINRRIMFIFKSPNSQ